MKTYVIIAMCSLMLSVGCKSKKESMQSNVSGTTSAVVGATTGKVSHQFRKEGCATVIVVTISETEGSLILIPKDKLPAKLDADGQEITFNYTMLKMPQPEGCNQGIPADIKDVAAKK